MKFGIVRFPGSNCDSDCFHVVESLLKENSFYLWHEENDLRGADCVILPGGFAHGDYLRTGAMAKISPIMDSIKSFAAAGGPVLGICNGFQVLTESGLLPGALLGNRDGKFVCDWINLRVENAGTPFTSGYKKDAVIRMPIAHGEGRYYLDGKDLAALEKNGQIVFRYCAGNGECTDAGNPNGSLASIAGVSNERGNVIGLMPHPERCCEASLGGEDGLVLFRSIRNYLRGASQGARGRESVKT